MPAFTPGPWVFEKDKLHPFFYVSKEKSKTFLATVNNEANARLIAAAPDLYNNVKALIHDIALSDECRVHGEIRELARIIDDIDGKED